MRSAERLLAAGAGLGIALGALGLLGAGPGRALPPDVVARVNGENIRADDYDRTMRALATDRRGTIEAAERRHVLDRLIDEELLVQRGLELGLARHDARVRRDLTAAVVDAVVTGHEGAEPSEAALRAFYEEHRDFFARPGRVRVRQVWCRVRDLEGAPAAEARAHEAAARLRAGERFADVRAALGDAEEAPLPDALLPPSKLLDYVGPTVMRAALALGPGGVSDPVRSGTGYHVLQVLGRELGDAAPLADLEPEVRAELQRRAGEASLRAYLDELRARARVEIASPLP